MSNSCPSNVNHMATNHSGFEVPSVREIAIFSIVLAATAFYVFVYGGPLAPLGLFALYGISIGLGLFTLYLFYRFVVAVEKIAEKY
jgi:hypothetical protein